MRDHVRLWELPFVDLLDVVETYFVEDVRDTMSLSVWVKDPASVKGPRELVARVLEASDYDLQHGLDRAPTYDADSEEAMRAQAAVESRFGPADAGGG